MKRLHRILIVISLLWFGVVMADSWDQMEAGAVLVAALPAALVVGLKWAAKY